MNIVYCERCDGKNLVTQKQLGKYREHPLPCRFCGNVMAPDTIFTPDGKTLPRNVLESSKYRLLFIDDDKIYLGLSQSILGRDYKVSIASSGAEGIAMAKRLQPDLILLDVGMPEMDGYETCVRIKNTPSIWHIPIFFLTAQTESELMYKGFSLGAVDYICKPLQLNILHARIDMQFRMKQLLEQCK